MANSLSRRSSSASWRKASGFWLPSNSPNPPMWKLFSGLQQSCSSAKHPQSCCCSQGSFEHTHLAFTSSQKCLEAQLVEGMIHTRGTCAPALTLMCCLTFHAVQYGQVQWCSTALLHIHPFTLICGSHLPPTCSFSLFSVSIFKPHLISLLCVDAKPQL